MARNADMSPALIKNELPGTGSAPYRAWITVRRLHPGENDLFLAHLERLDPETRRSRFGHLAGDAFLKSYSARSLSGDAVVEGLFVDGVLRGVAELRFSHEDRHEAEAAFSIERLFQGKGHGGRLFSLVVDAARNRGVTRLHLTCLRENSRIRALALKHGAKLLATDQDIVAELPARPADLASLRGEWRQEAEAMAYAFFEWRLASWKRWTTPFYGASGMARSLGQMFGVKT
ncbi:GNAT family N-acetyltransferase [Fulvimarina sp. MAC8]|uniref:GNAT family N-acetyltransferase n=1 Tax=Fulvimarina sp. MAC8 TaxID=3162874 RepID=UPI0032EDE5FC